MGGLNIFLLLSLSSHLTAHTELEDIKHHNEVFKNPKPRGNLEKIGKFRQSSIGSTSTLNTFKFKGLTQVKTDPKRYPEKPQKFTKIRSDQLVKEFEDFRKIKEQNKETVPGWKYSEIVENRVSRNDSIKKEKIIDELQQLLTSTEKEMSDAPLEITTSPSSEEEDLEEEVEEEEATTQSESEDPSPMGLTSDHEKRANPGQDSLDFPQDDGTFVIVVVGITLCAIAGVVGVGCFLHRPSCPRPPSPFSDCSPTFQSAKLAFSSSPEEKVNNSQQFKRNSHQTLNKGADKKNNSRAEKFRRGVDQDSQRSAGVPKLDSLINIDQEEDDDDLIYECPGLAPHGEMEVTNPFFLGKDFNTHIGEVDGGEKREGRKCEGHNLINTNVRHGTLRAAGQSVQ